MKRVIANWQEVIQQIKEQDFLKLAFLFPELRKKAIRNSKTSNSYKVSCPFHKEKTPSLSFNKITNRWLCFGCGRYGSIIDYYAKRTNTNFKQAIIDLAKIYKIKIEWKNKNT